MNICQITDDIQNKSLIVSEARNLINFFMKKRDTTLF